MSFLDKSDGDGDGGLDFDEFVHDALSVFNGGEKVNGITVGVDDDVNDDDNDGGDVDGKVLDKNDDEDDDDDDGDGDTEDGEKEGNANVKNDKDGDGDDGDKNNDNRSKVENGKDVEKVVSSNTSDGNRTITGNENKSPRKMNVLLFYPDDWRHDSIGSEKPYVLTPFLNSLAKDGIRFTHNAVTTSICWMSRATLWMGQYSSRHRSYKLRCPRIILPENWKHSWVKTLQNAGYFVGHIGKWQYWNANTESLFSWARLFEGQHWYRHEGKMIDGSTLARIHALDFFDQRSKDKPFVLSIAFYPPKPVGSDMDPPGVQWKPTNETRKLYDNVTIPAPEMNHSFQLLPKFLQLRGPSVERFKERYRTPEHYQASMKNYYALITGVDQACKEIVDKLKEEGLYNNTMIIFTTDNGMMHGAHGLAGKWYPYQESIRVPLIIYDPRMPKDKVGTLDDSFTLNVDLAETILGAAGMKPDELMQGRDISDLYLANEKNEYHDTASAEVEPWRQEFFYEFPSPEEVFIPSSTALVRKEWKYIYWPAHDREQLFHLKEDPLEMNDLYMDNGTQTVLDEMRKRHDELKAKYHDELYKDDPNCTKYNAQLAG